MKVAYRAIDGEGASVADVTEAPSVAEAVEALRRNGLFVTEAREATGREKPTRRVATTPGGMARLSVKELLLFTRQMAMLLKAGTPVVAALGAVGKQLRGPARSVVEKIREDTQGGQGLAEAMRQFPKTFSEIFVTIVGAGEVSAQLPEMFARLSALVERRRAVRSRLISAAVYPALLISLSSVILGVIVLFVVPRFNKLFESLDAPLPASTRFMFAVSSFARGHWMWLVGAVLVVLLAVLVVCKTPGGRRWLVDVKTRIPLLGILFVRLIQAQMFRVMGLLLESRVGLIDTLNLTAQISTNKDYQALCADMRDQVERGNPLSEAMVRSPKVTPAVAQAVSTGEQSGHLDHAMLFVADILDDENAQMIGTLTKLLEPTILILMGLLVGGIAMSLFIPLFDLAALSG